MRALVTGASGFLGRHVASHLAAEGAELYTLSRGSDHPSSSARRAYRGSIDDERFVAHVLGECRPTHVFHLAGILGGSDAAAADLYRTNVVGTAVFLDAVVARCPDAVVILSGSSAVYGEPERLPIREEDPFQPRTDYAVTKVAQEMIAISRFRSRGLRAVRTRNFNLIGPGQPRTLLAASIARQLVAAEMGGPPVVRLRETTGRRDFIDVRDAARAHALLATRGTPGAVYNVCSGVARSVGDALDILRQHSTAAVAVEVNPPGGSAPAVSEQVGSYERLHAAAQWQPRVSFEQSLVDLLEETRANMEREIPA